MPTMPTLSPATTAVPHPNSTRMNVPTISARYFFMFSSVWFRSRCLEKEILAYPAHQGRGLRGPGGPDNREGFQVSWIRARSVAEAVELRQAKVIPGGFQPSKYAAGP